MLAQLWKSARTAFTGLLTSKSRKPRTSRGGRGPLPDGNLEMAQVLVRDAWGQHRLSLDQMKGLEQALRGLRITPKEIRNELIPSLPAVSQGLVAARIDRIKMMLERMARG